jgi:replicative DNA helicase
VRQNRQVEVADNSRMMKILAKELEVPVILASQLNRSFDKRRLDKSTGDDARPALSDLRDSGAIEQDADIVMFVHDSDRAKREQEGGENTGKQEREILVEKHRGGETGNFRLQWVSSYTRFFNPTAAQASQEAQDIKDKQREEAVNKKPAKKKEVTEQTFVKTGGADVF